MRNSISTRTLILSAVAALLLAVAIPSTALAQGRGHGRGQGGGNWSNRVERNQSNRDWRTNRDWRNRSANLPNYNKKCGKFVNCHDARNGRIDGRGPRGTSVGNLVWRNRLRNRQYVNNNLVIRNRSNNSFWRNRTRRNMRRVTDNR